MWAVREGTMSPDFLHLEDKRGQGLDISQLYDKSGEIAQGDKVLTVLKTFMWIYMAIKIR